MRVSAEALDELITHLSEENATVQYAMVTVQTHRDVSNAVSTKLGIRHETPQALLVRHGRVVWSASHFRGERRLPQQGATRATSADSSISLRAAAFPATKPDDHAH